MPLDLSAEQFEKVWVDADTARKDMLRRQDYYTGKHDILKREETYADGVAKSNRVANWIQFIINRYVGLLTAAPYALTKNDEDTENLGLDEYKTISDANDLPRLDILHLRNALVKGQSVEVHGWNAALKGQTIDAVDPVDWAFVRDDRRAIVAAVRKVEMQLGTYYNGALLEHSTEIMMVYDDAKIVTYERAKKAGAAWAEISTVAHKFSRVPVLSLTLNDTSSSLISDSLIKLNDEYNDIFSTAGDDVRRDVDAVLKTTGVDADWITKNQALIRQNRVLPLNEGADAMYIQREGDPEPVTRHLQRTRDAVHMTGEVPDVSEILGATGSTSGIALRLKFLPMMQNANTMITYIKDGLRQRIQLINDRLRQTIKPQIEDYNIIINVSLPVNRIEEWMNIGALTGIVSHRKQLEMLSDVEDPEQELRRLERESEDSASKVLTPADAANVKEARVLKGADMVAGDMETLISQLSSALTERMIGSGAFG